jgi:hypothetical protein
VLKGASRVQIPPSPLPPSTDECHTYRVLRLVLATAVASLVFPVSALASLSFSFDRGVARQGQAVHAFQADPEGNPAPAWDSGTFDPATVTVYLVRLRDPFAWRLRLGPMQTDANQVWGITFRLPKKLRPGLYTTAFFCRPCGDTFFTSTLSSDRWTRKPSRVLNVVRR